MSLQTLADQMKSRGRGGDTELVHMTKGEVAGLQQLAMAAGGSLTINPDTGLPEASFLRNLLPTIIGGAVGLATMNPMAGAAAGAAVGGISNRDDPLMGALMGGIGGYGGAGLGTSLGAAGTAGAQQAAMSAVPQGATTAAHTAAQQAAMQEAALQGLSANEAAARASQQLLSQGFGSDAALQNIAASQATRQFAAQPLMSQAGQGISALGGEAGRTAAMQSLGGGMGAARTGLMAAAPMMMPGQQRPATLEETGSIPEYDFAYDPTGYSTMGSEEVRHFRPTFTRRAAAGGIMSLAEGGTLDIKEGDFIVPSDVTSFVGGGSTEAGQRDLAKTVGAIPIRGPGNGLSDDIPATIDGKIPARVADGEMLVRQPGKAGTKKLYAMMDNVRKQATGSKKQIRPVDLKKALA